MLIENVFIRNYIRRTLEVTLIAENIKELSIYIYMAAVAAAAAPIAQLTPLISFRNKIINIQMTSQRRRHRKILFSYEKHWLFNGRVH